MWVKFDEIGRAAEIFPVEMPGTEFVDGVDMETLIACRRVNGDWIPRDPGPPHQPTAEEIAAAQRERYEAALAARTEAVRAALMADPMYLDWQMGLVERTVWAVRAMQISASIPEPVEE